MKLAAKTDIRPEPGLGSLFSSLSLEITAKDAPELTKVTQQLAPKTPISITFLPNETFEKRLGAVQAARDAGFRPIPHLSARRITSEAELDRYLADLVLLGANEELFIVAGDPDEPKGPFADTMSIIESGLLEHYNVRCVGIGGYPEGHPKITDDLLWRALADKNDALARRGLGMHILTQFGFDADPVILWLSKVRDMGIHAPIRLGVPGPASATTLMKFAARCGVGASSSVLAKYGFSLTKLFQSAGPDKYVKALGTGLDPALHGQVGLHFYPFGGVVETCRWIDEFTRRHNLSS